MAAPEARSSSLPAAATETRVRGCFGASIQMKNNDEQQSPCSVHVHGPLVVYPESRKIGDTRSRSEHDEKRPPYFCTFDHRMEVADRSLFLSYVACRDLIHRMLAEGTLTGKYDLDLAADNWEDFKPHGIATTIVADVRRDTEDRCGVVPAYEFDIEMVLQVRLIYSEPRALLLACKEAAEETVAEAADALAGGRKRRRDSGGHQQCAICLANEGMEDEETVRLPCEHAFHERCIEPWFHRVSTCPTCRHDAMGRFDFVRSASAWDTFMSTMATSTTAEDPRLDNASSPRRNKRARRPNQRYI